MNLIKINDFSIFIDDEEIRLQSFVDEESFLSKYIPIVHQSRGSDFYVQFLLHGWTYDSKASVDVFWNYSLRHTLVVYVPIEPGYVDFVSSRDALDFTSRTQKFIQSVYPLVIPSYESLDYKKLSSDQLLALGNQFSKTRTLHIPRGSEYLVKEHKKLKEMLSNVEVDSLGGLSFEVYNNFSSFSYNSFVSFSIRKNTRIIKEVPNLIVPIRSPMKEIADSYGGNNKIHLIVGVNQEILHERVIPVLNRFLKKQQYSQYSRILFLQDKKEELLKSAWFEKFSGMFSIFSLEEYLELTKIQRKPRQSKGVRVSPVKFDIKDSNFLWTAFPEDCVVGFNDRYQTIYPYKKPDKIDVKQLKNVLIVRSSSLVHEYINAIFDELQIDTLRKDEWTIVLAEGSGEKIVEFVRHIQEENPDTRFFFGLGKKRSAKINELEAVFLNPTPVSLGAIDKNMIHSVYVATYMANISFAISIYPDFLEALSYFETLKCVNVTKEGVDYYYKFAKKHLRGKSTLLNFAQYVQGEILTEKEDVGILLSFLSKHYRVFRKLFNTNAPVEKKVELARLLEAEILKTRNKREAVA